MHRAQDDNFFDDDNAHDETKLRDIMVDGKEEAQISSHGEVGGIRTGIVVPTQASLGILVCIKVGKISEFYGPGISFTYVSSPSCSFIHGNWYFKT
jgi:hypothetical protein